MVSASDDVYSVSMVEDFTLRNAVGCTRNTVSVMLEYMGSCSTESADVVMSVDDVASASVMMLWLVALNAVNAMTIEGDDSVSCSCMVSESLCVKFFAACAESLVGLHDGLPMANDL